eukprot:2988530-Alexandrium_andersonii.AAC.1
MSLHECGLLPRGSLEALIHHFDTAQSSLPASPSMSGLVRPSPEDEWDHDVAAPPAPVTAPAAPPLG